jgi:hypothetical protein
MTSAINTAQIDEEYPVAGADNNSQGFRDNFTGIKTALNVAAGEITTLQNTTAKLNADNDFNSNKITDALYYNLRGTVSPAGDVSGTADINTSSFPVHWVTLLANTTLTFTNWPATLNQYACVRVEIRGGTTTANVVFSSNPSSTIKYATGFPGTFTVLQDEIHVVEAWTYNRSDKVMMRYLGKFA